MKRFCFYIALSVLTCVVSCQREELVAPESDDCALIVYATSEDITDAKTYMDEKLMLWSSGDQIAVFLKNTLRKRFTVAPESVGSQDAVFLHDSDYSITGSNSTLSNNVAYYPFGDVVCTPDGDSYKLSNIVLPSVQSYAVSSVGLGAYPMVAVTENVDDVNYHFKNICGALMFQLTGYGFIKSITVKGNSDEILAGPASVTAVHGSLPMIALAADGSKTVTLDCGEGVELSTEVPTSFIIALPPVPFTNGFTIIVTDTWGGTKEYSTSKTNSILRSAIRRMPSQEYVGIAPPQGPDYIDEYGVNHGQGVEVGGVVWAPVNCGYHETDFPYGKYYQWGRKYGQKYSPNYMNGPMGKSANLDQKYANLFFWASYGTPFDWCGSSDSTLWNSGTEDSPVKTQYDPCPEGWRVPAYTELRNLAPYRSSVMTEKNGQKGYLFNDSEENAVFLPAAGFIYYNVSSADLGKEGCYWSSTPSGKYYSERYSFTRTSSMDICRGNGFSVRCVAE